MGKFVTKVTKEYIAPINSAGIHSHLQPEYGINLMQNSMQIALHICNISLYIYRYEKEKLQREKRINPYHRQFSQFSQFFL